MVFNILTNVFTRLPSVWRQRTWSLARRFNSNSYDVFANVRQQTCTAQHNTTYFVSVAKEKQATVNPLLKKIHKQKCDAIFFYAQLQHSWVYSLCTVTLLLL